MACQRKQLLIIAMLLSSQLVAVNGFCAWTALGAAVGAGVTFVAAPAILAGVGFTSGWLFLLPISVDLSIICWPFNHLLTYNHLLTFQLSIDLSTICWLLTFQSSVDLSVVCLFQSFINLSILCWRFNSLWPFIDLLIFQSSVPYCDSTLIGCSTLTPPTNTVVSSLWGVCMI